MLLLGVVPVFPGLRGKPWQQCVRMATIWSFVFLLMQGFSILGAVLLDRRLSRSRRLGNVERGGGLVVGALGKAALAFVVGYAIGLATVWLAAQIFVLSAMTVAAVLARVWPWALIPAMTSGAIVYYLVARTGTRIAGATAPCSAA